MPQIKSVVYRHACMACASDILGKNDKMLHSQLSRTCLIGTLAYQQIDEKTDVNHICSGISGVW